MAPILASALKHFCLSRKVAGILLTFWFSPSWLAANPPNFLFPVKAIPSPPGLLLQWTLDTNACSYGIYRVPYVPGGVSPSNWIWLAEVPGESTSYLDSTAQTGQAYEYAVEKNIVVRSQLQTTSTILSAGREIPLIDQPGRLVLLVDRTHSSSLAPELAQLTQDLVGEGWQVRRHEVAPEDTPAQVWQLIKREYEADPLGVRAVFLLGRIPRFMVTATNAPGSHERITTWADDSVYGVMDPSVLNEQGQVRAQGYPVQLAVGRVDLSEMPAFAPLSETELLRRYLVKNHRFRHNLMDLPRRALIDDRFGDNRGPATMSWKLFAALFDPGQVSAQECLPTLSSQGYLWLAAGGYSSPTDAGSAITTFHFRDANPHIGFALLYGSLLGNWIYPDDILRAVLASPQYGLAAVYGLQLEPCLLYRLGLGETLGECIRAQQQASPARYCVNLMGDPTLRMAPVSPPEDLTAVSTRAGVELSWRASADPEVAGYHVYRSDAETGPFKRLTEEPGAQTRFLDPDAIAGRCCYLVRAVKLERSPTGTYWQASPGLFATVEMPAALPVVSINALVPRLRSHSTNAALFRILRSEPAGLPLAVRYQLGGTAQIGRDYVLTETNMVVAEGAQETWMTLKPLPSARSELIPTRGHTVVVSLLPDPAYQVGACAEAVLVIEPEEEVTVTVQAAPAGARNNQVGELIFRRSSPADYPLVINYALSGTARPGMDYEELARTVTLAPGATSVTLPIKALNLSTNGPGEGRKTVIATLQEGRGYRLGPQREASVSFLKDGALPVVNIKATIPVAQEAGLVPGEFTITRTGNLNCNLTIYLLGPSGTARFGDYTMDLNFLPRVPVVIPYGQSSIGLAVIPLNNNSLDFDKTLTFSLAPDSSYVVGESNKATVVVQESNAVGIPQVMLASFNAYREPLLSGMVELRRSGGTKDLAVTLLYAGTASSGVDYEPLTNTVTIPAGTNSARLFIRPIINDRGEGDKTIEVTLAPSPLYRPWGTNQSTVQIIDSGYNVWRIEHFGREMTNLAVVGRQADPDGDRTCNYLEYLFDMDPHRPDRIRPEDWKIEKIGPHLQISYCYRYSGSTGIGTKAQYTTNIAEGRWIEIKSLGSGFSIRKGKGQVWNRIALLPEMEPTAFFQIQFVPEATNRFEHMFGP